MGVRPHVVIVGAGFGGLAVARGLDKLPVEVTLVDRQNFTTFQPLLYQVATSGLNAADVAHPIRGLFHRQRNLHVLRGEVVGVDWDAPRRPPARRARRALRPPRPGRRRRGHVVRRAGRRAARHPALHARRRRRVRNHVLERFEAADADPSLIDDGELNFVVVGGGPTGVETAGALAELFSVVFKRDYPTLGVGRARVVLVEARDALLARSTPRRSGPRSTRCGPARSRSASTRPSTRSRADHVRFASGEVLPTRTVIWAAGVHRQPGRRRQLGLPTTRGGRVERRARPAGRRARRRVGGGRRRRRSRAPRRRRRCPSWPRWPCSRAATWPGRSVACSRASRPQPFRFRDKGTMATIGRRSAVAELPGRIRLRGTLAWFAWLGLHLLYLAGLRNRLSVLLNWAWGYVDVGPRVPASSSATGPRAAGCPRPTAAADGVRPSPESAQRASTGAPHG